MHRCLLAPLLLAALVAPALPVLVTASPAAAQSAAPALPELGYDRLGVRRGDTWVLRDDLDGGPGRAYREHTAGWQPVAGDTDGDGTGTVSLFRDGVWLLRDAEGGVPRTVLFGQKGDQPVLGDWNGDGIDTIGLFRGGRWHVRDVNLAGPARVFGYGLPGDVAVVGDWDGNGRTDIGVRRGVRWYQRDAAGNGPTHRTFDFGLRGDIPVAGDWDHDGRDTPGLFRGGTWFFRLGNFPSSYQTRKFGQPGDRPVVRRVPGLAPGVRHDVYRDPRGPWTAHIATVDLAAASSPETVLAGGRLQGLDALSTMTRRAGAVLGINGDYALDSGRPVHLFANDGRLAQTPQLLGRALGLDAAGTGVRMGFPDVRTTVTAPADTSTATLDVPRWNSGGPAGDALAMFTGEGALLEVPPNGACYAGLTPVGGRTMTAQGRVQTPLQVTGSRCGGERPVVPQVGGVLTANRYHGNEPFVRSLSPGSPVQLSTLLGFPGTVDAIGGNPMLVVGGQVADGDVTGSGGFFGRNPRTAVGVTDAGQLLLVVVDGRQGSYSAGMTLRELAELMRDLGARDAVNLDGGGSSEMFLNGLVVNRPSDGGERLVSSALVVLPGADPGQADLQAQGPVTSGGARTGSGSLRSDQMSDSLLGPAATDPASTGGLADALRRSGVRLPPALARTADAYARR